MTLRRAMRVMRKNWPERVWRTMANPDGERIVAYKPDWGVEPYDKLQDYWHYACLASNPDEYLGAYGLL